jgi:hypothetical protein
MEMECAEMTGRSLTRDGHREEGRRRRGGMLHAAWGQFLGRVPWEKFVTLTFDPSRRHGLGRRLAEAEALRWCTFLGWISRRPVGWMYAAEVGAGGMWHVHGLVVGLPLDCWPVAKTVWEKRNGRADIRSVDSPHVATLYTTKQAAETGTVVFADVLDRYLDGTAGRVGPTGERQ